jgi:hypothetical protein
VNLAITRLCAALLFAPAALLAHADIVGQSTSTSGTLEYVGMGDVGGGVGSGRYTLGTCVYAAPNTTCTLSGTYAESAQSSHAPGAGGSFTLQLVYPGNGPSPVVARSVSPGSDILQFASVGSATFTLTLMPSAGGQFVGVYPAAVFSESVVFGAFLDPANHSCTGVAAQQCTVGQVGLVAGATISGGVNPLTFTIPTASQPSSANYEGLWWADPAGSESGWGINFAHQGDVIFATWFTYDLNGNAWWISMTAQKTAEGVYGGTLYQTNGPAFNAVPFVPAGVTAAPVGTGTLTFASATRGTFDYTVNGVSQRKTIVPQVFSTPPICAFDAQNDLAAATNYQDLWWAAPAGSESGWGINLTHQGTTIFGTWFTYAVNGKPLWYSVTAPQTGAGTFSGTLYRTTGPAFNAVPFDPHGVVATPVGTATLTFTDGNTGTFAYAVNDGANVATQSKQITRQVFRPPGTVCHAPSI